jgi:hypothetical protein
MTREGDILHQNGGHYVHRDRLSRCITVYRPSASGTHALSDCSFTDDADGLSLAKARCDYLAKRAKP